MAILVTGFAGFIGSNFISYYLEKYKDINIIGLDKFTYAGNMNNILSLKNDNKLRLKIIKGDICNSKLIKEIYEKNNIQGIINFAAESHVDRSIHNSQPFIKTNILGTQTLLDAAKIYWFDGKKWKRGVKFLQISTDEVYGSLGNEGYFSEKTPLDPHSPYSASKASADLIVKSYFDTFNMPINITRCSNNYGPFQHPEKLIPLVINNALNHKKIPIYGNGKQVRDWVHVLDNCTAIDLVFNKAKPGEIYNIGASSEKQNIQIVKTIIKSLHEKTKQNKINFELIRYIKDRPGHDKRYAIDSSKIKKDLGWVPKIKFNEGINDTIDWYLNHRDWLDDIISDKYINFYKENYGD